MAATATKVGLDLFITGTCLIVPNRQKKHVAVLMPQTHNITCTHTGSHVMHQPSLAIREGHVDPAECMQSIGGWCIIDLSQWYLRLDNGTAPATYSIGEVYRLNVGLSRRAKSTFGSELQARVDLASGRSMGASTGKRFLIDETKEHMPNLLKWSIDDWKPKLKLTCLCCSKSRVISLKDAGKPRIEMFIQNVPASELNPDKGGYKPPKKKTEVHHFLALGQLLEPGHDPIKAPVWEGDDGDDVIIAAGRGGNPYTCMPGGTGPGDDGP